MSIEEPANSWHEYTKKLASKNPALVQAPSVKKSSLGYQLYRKKPSHIPVKAKAIKPKAKGRPSSNDIKEIPSRQVSINNAKTADIPFSILAKNVIKNMPAKIIKRSAIKGIFPSKTRMLSGIKNVATADERQITKNSVFLISSK